MKKEISRRHFVETLMWTTGALVSAPLHSLIADEAAAAADLVSVQGEMIPALNKALEALGGIKRFVKPGNKVVIKPNISFSSEPEVGANTHPSLVAEVARKCAEAGANEILVCDFPLRRPKACLQGSGIGAALENVPKTEIIYFTEKKFFEKVDVPKGKQVKKISVLRPVLDADVFINMPIAKTHSGAKVTFALKNLMGVIWERKSFHVRHDLHQAIADLATLPQVQPHLTILDASRTMVDSGPGGPGTLEFPNKIIAGTNQLEVDAVGVGVAKWNGRQLTARDIPHLLSAHELGLGEIDKEKLKYKELMV